MLLDALPYPLPTVNCQASSRPARPSQGHRAGWCPCQGSKRVQGSLGNPPCPPVLTMLQAGCPSLRLENCKRGPGTQTQVTITHEKLQTSLTVECDVKSHGEGD